MVTAFGVGEVLEAIVYIVILLFGACWEIFIFIDYTSKKFFGFESRSLIMALIDRPVIWAFIAN